LASATCFLPSPPSCADPKHTKQLISSERPPRSGGEATRVKWEGRASPLPPTTTPICGGEAPDF
jgi:hypothetical protein